MGEVTTTLNGRSYTLACGDGEEPRLKELIGIVSERVEALSHAHGPVSDARILLMAAVLIADELLDAREKVEALERMRRAREA